MPSASWLPFTPRELWESREILARLAAKEVTLRYRQTALGAVWVVLQPLMAAAIFAVVFGKVARLPSQGLPYLVFSYAGLIGWTAFSGTFTRASSSLLANASLVSKVFFPRILLPLASIWSVAIDFAVALVVMAGMLVAYRVHIGWPLLLLPLWLLLAMLAALGGGLVAGSVMVRYRDMQYVVPVVIQFLLFASPVAYSLAAVPPGTRVFFAVNPLTAVFEGFRWSLLGIGGIDARQVAYSVVAILVLVVAGLATFSRLERDFADVI